MKDRLIYLQRRRELLVAQSEAQRSELPFPVQDLQDHLCLVDMGFTVVQFMREHPALTLASATLLLPSGSNKILLWSSRLLTTWKLFTLVRKRWRHSG